MSSEDLNDDDSVSSYDSNLEELERDEEENHADFVVDDDEATDSDYEPSELSESSESYESEVDVNGKRKRNQETVDTAVLLSLRQIQEELRLQREELARMKEESEAIVRLRKENDSASNGKQQRQN